MSLPDASGQARTAALMLLTGMASRVVIHLAGLLGKRLPRAVAFILDTLAFAFAAALCAVTLFVCGESEVRLPLFLLFALGMVLLSVPRALYRRFKKEKADETPNTPTNGGEG